MSRQLRWTGFAALLLLATGGLASAQENQNAVAACRLKYPELQETILQALAYLEDNQIRDRPGRGSPVSDSTFEGDGSRGRTAINFGRIDYLGLPGGPVANLSGGWASQIHHLVPVGLHGRNFKSYQDSNMFVSASVAYCLFMVDDSTLAPPPQTVSDMLGRALHNVNSFKNGDAYNFMPRLPGYESPHSRVGPPNWPVGILRPFLGIGWCLIDSEVRNWSRSIFDPEQNPTGVDAFWNVPNDADDTAMAVLVQTYFAQRYPTSRIVPDLPALQQVTHFLDLCRPQGALRQPWKQGDTGAYLTWLRDENEPTFGRIDLGVIPFWLNRVDVVVNANVASALAALGLKDAPGYMECLRLLAWTTCRPELWEQAAMYYPNAMTVPYTVSRAYRHGATEGPMKAAMQYLLRHLLHVQEQYARRHPWHSGAFPGETGDLNLVEAVMSFRAPLDVRDGRALRHPWRASAFPGGTDYGNHMATAMGLCALLNLGRDMACELNEEARYNRAVENAVSYLIRKRHQTGVVYETTRARLGTVKMAFWESGVHFCGGGDNFAFVFQWRSHAITAGVVLEALSKYAIAFDHGHEPAFSRRLALLPAPGAGQPLRFGIAEPRPETIPQEPVPASLRLLRP
jgi:hypothetical protein